MKVWVIMGNDYPDAVRLTEVSANKYIEQKKKQELSEQCAGYKAHIYWRAYEFEAET